MDKARIEKVDPTFVNASIMSRNEMQDVAKATLSLQKPLNSGNSNLFMEENQTKGPSSFSKSKIFMERFVLLSIQYLINPLELFLVICLEFLRRAQDFNLQKQAQVLWLEGWRKARRVGSLSFQES